MRILMISTYELGRQPVHLASPAAALKRAGHDVIVVDTAVEELSWEHVSDAEAVGISVPMHTATRLAIMIATQIKTRRPEVPIALFGLYAGVPDPMPDPQGPDAFIAGEYEPGLLDWVRSLGRGEATSGPLTISHTGRSDFEVPERSGLPGLDAYARLEHNGRSLLAGAVEASHGCRHRCRHCPIPAVYDGRMRVVPKDVVLADIAQVVEAGGRHVTFGDPDFLNAPRHSLDVLEAAHEAHPEVTFDVTVKVEHILRHVDLWPRLAELNLLFVVSAFESVDDRTLHILDKGHTVADMSRAVDLIRSADMHIRPTWLPFVPWTNASHIVEMFRFIDRHHLVSATDPVQMSIKLLIPRGSLLEDHPAVKPSLQRYDTETLTWEWRFDDPQAEALHRELSSIAADASECGHETVATFADMWQAVGRTIGEDLGSVEGVERPAPRLTESWFCCAEPTDSQVVSIGAFGG